MYNHMFSTRFGKLDFLDWIQIKTKKKICLLVLLSVALLYKLTR